MYKSIFIHLAFLLPLLGFSQPINSWPTGNTTWELLYYDDTGNPTGPNRIYHLDGDTTLQGQVFQKIHLGPLNNSSYYAATREDSLHRVWVIAPDSTNAHLLFDFGAQAGDTVFDVYGSSPFISGQLYTMVVHLRDTISLLDGSHLRLTVEPLSSGGGLVEWIDGVGITLDFLHPIYHPLVSGTDRLICNVREGVLVYGNGPCTVNLTPPAPTGFSVYPSPAHQFLHLELAPGLLTARCRLINLRGQVVWETNSAPDMIAVGHLPSGLYFLSVEVGDQIYTQKVVLDHRD